MSLYQDLHEWAKAVDASGKAIIVEGKNDAEALRECGITNPIYELTGKALFEVIEEVAKAQKDVIILTDLDREGKKLYGTLSSGLQNHGMRIDNVFREWLFKESKVRQIEGMDSVYLKELTQAHDRLQLTKRMDAADEGGWKRLK